MIMGKISKVILIIVYVAVLVLQMVYFVPYEEMMVKKSNNNELTQCVVGNGYTSLLKLENTFVIEDEYVNQASCKHIDSPQLVVNVTLTTIIATAIYFMFIHKTKNDK
jgi:hypothetical protein